MVVVTFFVVSAMVVVDLAVASFNVADGELCVSLGPMVEVRVSVVVIASFVVVTTGAVVATIGTSSSSAVHWILISFQKSSQLTCAIRVA